MPERVVAGRGDDPGDEGAVAVVVLDVAGCRRRGSAGRRWPARRSCSRAGRRCSRCRRRRCRCRSISYEVGPDAALQVRVLQRRCRESSTATSTESSPQLDVPGVRRLDQRQVAALGGVERVVGYKAVRSAVVGLGARHDRRMRVRRIDRVAHRLSAVEAQAHDASSGSRSTTSPPSRGSSVVVMRAAGLGLQPTSTSSPTAGAVRSTPSQLIGAVHCWREQDARRRERRRG